MTSTNDLVYLTATEAIALFKEKKLSPVELLDAQIARIEAVDAQVNAVHSRWFDAARQKARAAEAAYLQRSGTPLPLEGVTMALKNEHQMAGQPVDIGSLLLAGHVAERNSSIVDLLLKNGAIFHTMVHVSEFCLAAYTRTQAHGVTRNPWNRAITCGGSSGGSGVALAAGMTTLATGSDIAGSIRIPASQCGVVGFKASHGRIPEDDPRYAMHAHTHNGVMSRSVADAILGFNVTNGPHPDDITTMREKLELSAFDNDVRGLRVAVSYDLGGQFEVSPDVRANTAKVAGHLRDLGAVVEEVPLDWGVRLDEVYIDGVAGILSQDLEPLVAGNEELVSDYVVDMMRRVRSRGIGEYLQALGRTGEMHEALQRQVFDRFDVLLCPTVAQTDTPAEGDLDAAGNLLRTCMTFPFNTLSRYPVLSVPSGFADNGVPTGVQIVGQTYCDAMAFRVGMALEEPVGWLNWRPVF